MNRVKQLAGTLKYMHVNVDEKDIAMEVPYGLPPSS